MKLETKIDNKAIAKLERRVTNNTLVKQLTGYFVSPIYRVEDIRNWKSYLEASPFQNRLNRIQNHPIQSSPNYFGLNWLANRRNDLVCFMLWQWCSKQLTAGFWNLLSFCISWRKTIGSTTFHKAVFWASFPTNLYCLQKSAQWKISTLSAFIWRLRRDNKGSRFISTGTYYFRWDSRSQFCCRAFPLHFARGSGVPQFDSRSTHSDVTMPRLWYASAALWSSRHIMGHFIVDCPY